MESTETAAAAKPDRTMALAEAATASRPLTPEAEASLARAVERLPGAIAKSDDEARPAGT